MLLYDTEIYTQFNAAKMAFVKRGLLWQDICDSTTEQALMVVNEKIRSRGQMSRYELRKISHDEPQISFIVLHYKDGRNEVLFNWDYRGKTGSPHVLLSREREIVNMFLIQFEDLLNVANETYDSNDTRSTS